jgi:hypothetical protein
MSTNVTETLLACLLGCVMGAACAQGSLLPGDEGGTDDTGAPREDDAADVSFDTPPETNDTAPRDSSKEDTRDVSRDTEPDSSPGLCARQTCDGAVCNPETGECVECIDDGDCPNGECKSSTNVCLGCTSDGDCTGDALCHDRESVCVDSCCSTNIEQPFAETRVVSEVAITTTDEGAPSILVGDDDANKLKFGHLAEGQWSTEHIADTTFGSDTDVELVRGPQGVPHAVRADGDELVHYWRPDDQWMSEDILPADKRFDESVDIAVDSGGTFHMVVILEYGDEVLYATRSPDGTRNREYLTLPDFGADNPRWVNLALTPGDRPVASFHIEDEDVLVVAERSGGGNWSYETVGNTVEQVHGMDVGPDGQPTIAYRNAGQEGLYNLRLRGGDWENIEIVSDQDHGFKPDVAVDSLGDPHIVYKTDIGVEPSMYYARWNGNDWEHHAIPEIEQAESPLVTLDSEDTPHVAVNDSDQNAISYIRID